MVPPDLKEGTKRIAQDAPNPALRVHAINAHRSRELSMFRHRHDETAQKQPSSNTRSWPI